MRIVTQDDNGRELGEPSIRDLALYQNVYIKVDKCISRIVSISDGLEIIATSPEGPFVQVDFDQIYPILRPLSELKHWILSTPVHELEKLPVGYQAWIVKLRNLDSWESLIQSCPSIDLLRVLRDNGFCTADFRFPNEVKHAREGGEQ